MALYTGQRKGDLIAMRWDALQGDVVVVRQEKTSKHLALPLHRELRTVIATIPKRAITILCNFDGRPWTKSAFNTVVASSRAHGAKRSCVSWIA
jgi:integrase